MRTLGLRLWLLCICVMLDRAERELTRCGERRDHAHLQCWVADRNVSKWHHRREAIVLYMRRRGRAEDQLK